MVPRIFYPLLPYRSMLFPFFVVSAIVVPCWLIFRWYRHRAGRQALSLSREILLLIFVVYLGGLASATLTPNRSTRLRAEGSGGIDLRPNLTSLTCSTANVPEGSRERGFCVRNAQGNAALFFPLGILIPLVWKRIRFRRAVLIAFAVSISIEVAQYLSSALGSYRAADINDVILNVFGAILGMTLVFLLRLLLGGRPRAAPLRPSPG
jgi:glycopeptide antibiotics resistance protein